MSTTPPATRRWHSDTGSRVTKLFSTQRSDTSITVRFAPNTQDLLLNKGTDSTSALNRRPQWADKEYREAYMEAAIEQGVAWQIKLNRKARNLTQAELASRIGTKQSAVSRFEDPEYGSHSLDTLIEIAKAFDCALSVKFVSYGKLAEEAEQLSEENQIAVPYDIDARGSNG